MLGVTGIARDFCSHGNRRVVGVFLLATIVVWAIVTMVTLAVLKHRSGHGKTSLSTVAIVGGVNWTVVSVFMLGVMLMTYFCHIRVTPAEVKDVEKLVTDT